MTTDPDKYKVTVGIFDVSGGSMASIYFTYAILAVWTSLAIYGLFCLLDNIMRL